MRGSLGETVLFLKNNIGGQFLGRIGQVDTESPINAGNWDADRPTDIAPGLPRASAAAANNFAAAAEGAVKAVVAPYWRGAQGLYYGGNVVAKARGEQVPSLGSRVAGGIGGGLAGYVLGWIERLIYIKVTAVDAFQSPAAVCETISEGMARGCDNLFGTQYEGNAGAVFRPEVIGDFIKRHMPPRAGKIVPSPDTVGKVLAAGVRGIKDVTQAPQPPQGNAS